MLNAAPMTSCCRGMDDLQLLFGDSCGVSSHSRNCQALPRCILIVVRIRRSSKHRQANKHQHHDHVLCWKAEHTGGTLLYATQAQTGRRGGGTRLYSEVRQAMGRIAGLCVVPSNICVDEDHPSTHGESTRVHLAACGAAATKPKPNSPHRSWNFSPKTAD